MTYDTFRNLVRRMRDKQKRYFKSRDPEALTEARQLEREVDNALSREGMESLFDNEGRLVR